MPLIYIITLYPTRPSIRESFSENIKENKDDQEDTPINVTDYNLLYYNQTT